MRLRVLVRAHELVGHRRLERAHAAVAPRRLERAHRRARRRSPVHWLLLVLPLCLALPLMVVGCGSSAGRAAPRRPVGHTGATQTSTTTTVPVAGPNLAPGSNPAVLPGPVLIADRDNNRLIEVDPAGNIIWQFPQPGDLAPGQTFLGPDDAFYTPDGKEIVATQELDYVITVIDAATHKIVWRYGTPGAHGSGPNQLWNPDDAIGLPNDDIITADIKNCRLLLLQPGVQTPLHVFGTTTVCAHGPPNEFGSPNGVFPMSNGHYVVSEINGNWIDEIGLDGHVYNAVNPPGVRYPSDTNEVSPGVFLTADFSHPGQIETFNTQGQLIWRFAPGSGAALNQPSLAVSMPNGDVISNDDYNHRVIVVDPRTNAIVWQYGHTGAAGSAPGYLDKPDGLDLAPPYSLAVVHRTTMGVP